MRYKRKFKDEGAPLLAANASPGLAANASPVDMLAALRAQRLVTERHRSTLVAERAGVLARVREREEVAARGDGYVRLDSLGALHPDDQARVKAKALKMREGLRRRMRDRLLAEMAAETSNSDEKEDGTAKIAP